MKELSAVATAIEIDSVTKTFDDLVAVDDVSLSVSEGQTLGLIGPNGAGKTTLLRMICTLAKPDHGDIRVQNQSVLTHPRDVRLTLGFMPAEFGSPRNLNIQEYLEYFACMHGVPPAERRQRIADVCELTDLVGREDVMVKGLSTGNKQRLLLAKTLLHDPQVLVLDEPASGLDPRARNELRAIIRQLAALGKTIVISSHILPDLEDISDTVAILEAGRLVVGGDLDTLRHQADSDIQIVRLRVPARCMDETSELLLALDEVESCHREATTIVVHYRSDSANFILAELIRRDIRVMQFSEAAADLEEIFMRSTAGRVT